MWTEPYPFFLALHRNRHRRPPDLAHARKSSIRMTNDSESKNFDFGAFFMIARRFFWTE